MLEFSKDNFSSLAEAKAYPYTVNTKKITEGVCKQFLLDYENFPCIITNVEGNPVYPNKWAHMRAIRNDLQNPYSSIIDVMMTRLESNGHFEIDVDTQAGLANIMLAHSLEDVLFKDINEVNAFLDLTNLTTKPYQDKTQADWDALDAPEPVEQAVIYNANDYEIKTGSQGFEFDITILDGSTDNIFDVRLETCEVDQGQHDINNWFEINNAFTPVRQGKGNMFKWFIDGSSKRTKTYNRFYFTPRKACEFSVSVKVV